MRPFAHLPHKAVLDRVEMDVIDMPFEIVVVADAMFPKAPLPNGRFSAAFP